MPSDSKALNTDYYELTMAAGYFVNGFNRRAVFELYCHTLPENRNFLIACGLRQAVDYILNLRFTKEDITFLRSQPVFKNVPAGFFSYLKDFRFSGNVWALPEGEICFANEPILQVEAPILEAQILETYLLSIINIETLVATKAARIIKAASCDGKERSVVDFGSRRAHGPEAGFLAARAAYLGGCIGTSNVAAGRAFGIPIFGTMAHSWIQAFGSEKRAFENYHAVFPENTILLIDTYDTVKGAQKAVTLPASVKGVRLDSGNLKVLSRQVRKILDKRGWKDVKILASGNLNEFRIQELVKDGAPIDHFGVGTDLVTSRDTPVLDLTYKLVQTKDIRGKVHYTAKLSQGKHTVPGRKQVFRNLDNRGGLQKDMIGLAGEKVQGNCRPLLRLVIERGKFRKPLLEDRLVRESIRQRLSHLPKKFFSINRKATMPVAYTSRLKKLQKTVQKFL